jgi:flavin-dependent dehydrogenase
MMPRCDVLVVGAGLAGLWTARRLAGAGLDVLLVDGRAGVDQQIRTTAFVRRTLRIFPSDDGAEAGGAAGDNLFAQSLALRLEGNTGVLRGTDWVS